MDYGSIRVIEFRVNCYTRRLLYMAIITFSDSMYTTCVTSGSQSVKEKEQNIWV